MYKTMHEEISSRLPVPSVVRFRALSKELSDSLKDPVFISSYENPNIREHNFLISLGDDQNLRFVDDSTCLSRRSVRDFVSIIPPHFYIFGSSLGILGFRGREQFLLLNPYLRISRYVPLPAEYYGVVQKVVFAVCPISRDPRIALIIRTRVGTTFQHFSLETGVWSVPAPLPFSIVSFTHHEVATDQFAYCLVEVQRRARALLIFDATSLSFDLVTIPINTPNHRIHAICKRMDGIAILERPTDFLAVSTTVWMMDNQRTFTKVFTLLSPHRDIVAFKRSGTPIVKISEAGTYKFVVLEPNSDENLVEDPCIVQVSALVGMMSTPVTPYMESLVMDVPV